MSPSEEIVNPEEVREREDSSLQGTFHGSDDSIPRGLMIGTERRLFSEGSEARVRLRQYAEAFSHLDVIVFTRRGQDAPEAPVTLSERIVLYPTNSAHRLLYVLDAIRVGRRLLKAPGSGRTTIVTAQDPFECGTAAAALTKRLAGTRLHLQVHTDLLAPAFAKESFLNRVRVWLATRNLKRADCVRVVSERIARSLTGLLKVGRQPYVLPIHIDKETFLNRDLSFDLHEAYPQFKFIFLVVSRLESVKNVDHIIKAFAGSFPSRQSEVGLVIVGNGSKRAELERYVSQKGLSERVVFAGWQTDTTSYFKTADAFVNFSSYEGYCLSLIEAALARCPIISSDVGVVGEVFDSQSIYLVNEVSIEALGRQMQKLYENDEERKQKVERAFAAAPHSVPDNEDYKRRYSRQYQSCFASSV